MTARRPISSDGTALWILAVLGAIFFMRAARPLLIPIALAVLISYALEPGVAWLERHRVPRMAGSALSLLFILALLSGGAYVLKDDAVQVVEAVPQAMERAREFVVSRIGSGSEAVQPTATGSGGAASGVPESLIQRAAGAIFTLAGNFVVVFFLVFFLLMLVIIKSVADHVERFKPIGRLMAP